MSKFVFDNVEVSKKEFYKGKKAVNLKYVIADNIVTSGKEIMKLSKLSLVP